MEIFQSNSSGENAETQFAEIPVPMVFDWEKPQAQETQAPDMEEDESQESLIDSMVCDSNSRLVLNGFSKPSCKEDVVIFINAGAQASVESDSSLKFLADNFFQGGDTFQTEELIAGAGDYSFLYQSARLGDFCYQIEDLPPGDYLVDLHFAEIINVNGPKGMRVFDVSLQDEKVLCEFDIFSIVGANKPLQLIDCRVSIKEGETFNVKFEGTIGSPLLSGICVRRAPTISARQGNNHLVCVTCASKMEFSPAKEKVLRLQSAAKYEKKIQELSDLLKRKTDECYQSWMSYSSANEQLEKIKMELDTKSFQTYSLDQSLDKQAEVLREISARYEHDKKSWNRTISGLQEKIKIMKQEHSQLSRQAHECADSIPQLNEMVFAVQSLVDQCEDLKVKYIEEQAKCRKLYNQVQDAKGNIRVFCRCRPLSKTEISGGCSMVVDFDVAKDGELGVVSGSSSRKTFKFDRVYTPKDSQVDVFADASPVVISVLDGYNVCIFAYGQTGTGKTFTMEGTEDNRGVNYRTLEKLFKIAKERSDTFTFEISVSVLEVYNEQIRDLLATSSTSKKLEIKHASEGLHHIPGIVEARVGNITEVWNVLRAGSSARAVGSNNVNEHSSRSHCMLSVMVKAKNLINGECTKSKLWLVDLAGSERLAKTDVQGERLKEAQNINKSLSALGDVISALANKSSHIPYRNSKLTHLLQDSLGGDSKTLMFVQISPSDQDLSETLSSLNFATRVRGVELGPARKQVDTTEVQKIKLSLDKARQELKSKDEYLKKLEENLQNQESKARAKEQVYRNVQDKLKDLEGQLEIKTSLHSQSEKQVLNVLEKLKRKEEACAHLEEKVTELENKLREQGQIESATYQTKVIEMESKLKAQIQESESHCIILQHKVEDLEKQLKEKEHDPESVLLCQKIKELEDKIREQEQQLTNAVSSNYAHALRSTPHEGKQYTRAELIMDSEHRILRCSNSISSQVRQISGLSKESNSCQDVRRKRLSSNSDAEINTGLSSSSTDRRDTDSLHEVRRKRLSRNSETENIPYSSTTANDRRGRQSDPPKPLNGVSRTTKPVNTSQRPLIRNKTSRDPVQGLKERDNKKRIWSR